MIVLIFYFALFYEIRRSEKGPKRTFYLALLFISPFILYFLGWFTASTNYDIEKEREKEKAALEEMYCKKAEKSIADNIIKNYKNSLNSIKQYKSILKLSGIDNTYKYFCANCIVENGIIPLDDFNSKIYVKNNLQSIKGERGKALLLELHDDITVNFQEQWHENDNCRGYEDDECYAYIVAATVQLKGDIIESIPLYSFFEDEYEELHPSDEHDYYCSPKDSIQSIVTRNLGKSISIIFDH